MPFRLKMSIIWDWLSLMFMFQRDHQKRQESNFMVVFVL